MRTPEEIRTEPATDAVTIRTATPADRAALYRIFVDSGLTFWAPHLPAEARARFDERDPVAGFLDATIDRLEVAEIDGVVVGAILVEDDRLEDLHVALDQRGHGIGALLLNRAVARGARPLEVRAFNAQAIAFYDHIGWQRSGVIDTTEMGVPVRSLCYSTPEEG
jgi:putative acetyltransferase